MEIWDLWCSLCVCVSFFPSLIYLSFPLHPFLSFHLSASQLSSLLTLFCWQPCSCCFSRAHTHIESPWSSWEFSALSLPLKWVGLACYRTNWTNLISFLPAVNLCQKLLLWAAILVPSRPIWTRQEATSWITTFRKTHRHTEIHIRSHTHYTLLYTFISLWHTSNHRDDYLPQTFCKLFILCNTTQGTSNFIWNHHNWLFGI